MLRQFSFPPATAVVVVLVILCSSTSVTTGYITSKSALPTPRQLQYLKQITVEICDSPPGELTDGMIADSHQVMKGWTRLSKTASTLQQKQQQTSVINNKSKKNENTPLVIASKENAVAVENLVKRLIDETKAGNIKANPTTEDYNCMLESWARSGEGVFAAERCEQILTQMQQQYEKGDPQVQPDLSSFKISLMAWKHAGGDALSSFRAQRILEWMISLYQSGRNGKACPDQMCFDSVLQSWSRNNHKRAPVYAETLLGTMEKLSHHNSRLRPRTLSFNAVLAAWARAAPNHSSTSSGKHDNHGTDNPKAWQRAVDILSFMENLYFIEGNSDVEPDLVSYHIVMGALARSADPRAAPAADKILKFVEAKHKEGSLSWKPDKFLFNSAMGCWAHADTKDAYRKACSILDRQIHYFEQGIEECRPDVYGFTSVLSTCASEPGDKASKAKAFNVALSTFQQLVQNQEEYGSPNHVTYGTMLKCVAHLLPRDSPERKKWTRKIFRECTSNGMVGGMVLARVREASSSSAEYKELMQGHSKGQLPKTWTRNVHEKSEHRRRAFIGKRGEV
ncbi:hypothetical protein IV203_030960 [Nitzschia inconspicua]|uniref:Secreted protein n=1 Tax=Nitzschia inconspicua TaxID=303405 RepID=A0A9K3Q1Q6_9STRA|nr:hypothetical protein IV203_030960 [Nitzschia inconspicua]